MIILYSVALIAGLGGLVYVNSPFFNSGADGLSGFLLAVFLVIVTLIGILGLISVFVSQFFPSNQIKIIIYFVPIVIGLICIGYFLQTVSQQTNSYIETANQSDSRWEQSTKLVTSTALVDKGVSFTYADRRIDSLTNETFNQVSEEVFPGGIMLLDKTQSTFPGLLGLLVVLPIRNTIATEIYFKNLVATISNKCSIVPQGSEHPFILLPAVTSVYKLLSEQNDTKTLTNCVNGVIDKIASNEFSSALAQYTDYSQDVYFIVEPSSDLVLIVAASYSTPLKAVDADLQISAQSDKTGYWYSSLQILQ